MRRRKLVVAQAGLAVVVAAGAALLWSQLEPDRITAANFERIHKGMTRAEVEAILGLPGDYTTGATHADPEFMFHGDEWFNVFATGPAWPLWEGDAIRIQVGFDDSDHATHKGRLTAHRWEQSPFDNLLWRAKRQWHRWFP
jgi:hypothetical protein